jgi:hypothetical protein
MKKPSKSKAVAAVKAKVEGAKRELDEALALTETRRATLEALEEALDAAEGALARGPRQGTGKPKKNRVVARDSDGEERNGPGVAVEEEQEEARVRAERAEAE